MKVFLFDTRKNKKSHINVAQAEWNWNKFLTINGKELIKKGGSDYNHPIAAFPAASERDEFARACRPPRGKSEHPSL